MRAKLRQCPRPPRNRCLPSSVRRPGRRGVACSASAADADVVDLFDAAKLTVDKFVKSGMVVGFGSGPASALAVQYLGTRLRRGSLTDIVAVTSSVLSASEADKAGIRASSYQEGTQLDFAFTDAEAIEEGTLAAVIGRRKTESGEPSFMVEKQETEGTVRHIRKGALGLRLGQPRLLEAQSFQRSLGWNPMSCQPEPGPESTASPWRRRRRCAGGRTPMPSERSRKKAFPWKENLTSAARGGGGGGAVRRGSAGPLPAW
ncbi:putative ribose-5-phosphate isomerase 4, chloroplastic [Panicum miliaceum]|uniref:Ribose-5-phosphate isomerase 4, chloroplastic n=1 Tax=Panicum miliaceum TaxID=4540 RepID=A0A3L6S9W3_PANMI|nr:putative ribose-5-phosphate isomerase 4, chloroplastic [Panicum miliaceum]